MTPNPERDLDMAIWRRRRDRRRWLFAAGLVWLLMLAALVVVGDVR